MTCCPREDPQYTEEVEFSRGKQEYPNTPRTHLFKLMVGIPLAILVGILLSRIADLVINRPYAEMSFNLSTLDFHPVLTTRRGEPVVDRPYGYRLTLDPFTVYRNLPNQKNRSFTIDSRGFRVDGAVVANPNTIVVGGSAAFGQSLRPGEKPFAEIMNERSHDLTVANASVMGFVSSQELALIVHYLDDLNPTLYIVFDGWNDLFDPFAHVDSWPGPLSRIGVQSTFFDIEARLLAGGVEGSKQTPAAADEEQMLSTVLLEEEEFYNEITENYLRNIGKMAAFARSRGAEVIVVFQPEIAHKKELSFRELSHLEYWNRSWGYVDRGFPERYEEMAKMAAAFCANLEIPFLDMVHSQEINGTAETLFYDVVHFNQRGHEIVAAEILRFLSDQGNAR